MLKIKDDVDLKELEKFGFTYFDDKRSYRYGCLVLQKGNVEVFINNARVISIVSDKSIFDLDIIYDLILNGLVEKVGGSNLQTTKYKDRRLGGNYDNS